MSLLSTFSAWKKFRRASEQAEKIASFVEPFLNVTGQMSSNALYQNVKSWDLSNELLVSYLGYVAGVLECARDELGTPTVLGWTPVEIVFQQVICGQLEWIDGIEEFKKLSQNEIDTDGTVIGLVYCPRFADAMDLGRKDFRLLCGEFRPDYFQKGLWELGLVRGGATSVDAS